MSHSIICQYNTKKLMPTTSCSLFSSIPYYTSIFSHVTPAATTSSCYTKNISSSPTADAMAAYKYPKIAMTAKILIRHLATMFGVFGTRLPRLDPACQNMCGPTCYNLPLTDRNASRMIHIFGVILWLQSFTVESQVTAGSVSDAEWHCISFGMHR